MKFTGVGRSDLKIIGSRSLLFVIICSSLILSPQIGHSQKKRFQPDTSYYETYFHSVILRAFVTEKHEHFQVPARDGAQDLEFRANKKFNTGMGITWHNLTLNGYYGLSTLNKDTAKGKTKGLDLQFHFFPRKWMIDVLVIMPKGMFISPKGYGSGNSNEYFHQDDIKMRMFGINAYRVPDKEKFSFRALMNQAEWQKKSAGSALFGGGINYVIMEAGDSGLIPRNIRPGFPEQNITEIRYISIGPGAGYAYTWVIDRHFFISAAVIGTLNVNMETEERGDESTKKTSIGPSIIYKGALGYNSSKWALAFSTAGNAFWTKGISVDKYYYLRSGLFRISLSRKLHPKNKDK